MSLEGKYYSFIMLLTLNNSIAFIQQSITDFSKF